MEQTEDVEQLLGPVPPGSASTKVSARLKELLTAPGSTFDTRALRQHAGSLHLQAALQGAEPEDARLVLRILCSLPGGSALCPPTDEVWVDAANLGRASQVLNDFFVPEDRHEAVVAAALRLKGKGFRLEPSLDGVDDLEGLAKSVTVRIKERLARLGLCDGLWQIFGAIQATGVSAYGQFLFGRTYSQGPGSKTPSIPFGFLLNLAVQSPDRPIMSKDPANDWSELVELATDLVAVIDIEPYNKFWMLNLPPRRVGRLMQELGFYDHLFTTRQWPIDLTAPLLENVLLPYSSAIFDRWGFDVADVLLLVHAIAQRVGLDPVRISRADLLSTALSAERLDKMLPILVHASHEVNRSYDSPLNATSADLFFRPLLEGAGGTYLALAAPLVGPACYEAFAQAARSAIAKKEHAQLVGGGTERVVAAVLRAHALTPTFCGAKYNEGKPVDAGECDFVLETETHIVLIETKAKALTRATMAGEPGSALLDFGASVIQSQIQAMQHERLLHRDGAIDFDDGRRLERRGRAIIRVSATLLDHGSLHDRWVFLNVARPLLVARLRFNDDHPRAKSFEDLNETFDRFNKEWLAAAQRGSDVGFSTGLAAIALSVGQLESLLAEAKDVTTFIAQLQVPATYATLNPLLEAYHMRRLIRSSESAR